MKRKIFIMGASTGIGKALAEKITTLYRPDYSRQICGFFGCFKMFPDDS